MYAFLPRTLPEPLTGLTELALDLRWTWNHAVDTLWKRIDGGLWERTRNPWVVLQNVPQERLQALAGDAGFAAELAQALTERRAYHEECPHCAGLDGELPRTVAYFSMEFGLGEAFPLYAGGLGVLAGDYLKTASDLGLPLVGVGLLYQEGYFRQVIDAGGHQRETYPYNDPTSLPIQPAIGNDGAWLELEMPLPGRVLYLRVWQAQVGRSHLYLLDSNDVRNGPVDRGITAKLYGGSSEIRLLQQVVLGMGGCALLDTLSIEAEICHLNEGHAALAVLERARRYMHRAGITFEQAWWACRAGNVFTTHTPVAAGFDAYAPELVGKYARGFLDDAGLSLGQLLALGRQRPDDAREPFNMAYLALRGCAHCNGVSARHGAVSRQLFQPLYPRWPRDEVPVSHVTNGVHVPSWDSAWADQLWTRACGKRRWRGPVAGLSEALAACDDASLWQLAASERRDLIAYARERLAWQLDQRGERAAEVAAAAQVLDPNILTIGMARRFATYKRPNLLLHDPDRLARLLCDDERPLQLIVAGKAHPDDAAGKTLVQAWLAFTRQPQLRHRAVFLEDYDMALAQHLVQGVDVWLNTPRPPWEACGTSGMKTLVNGGLNLSVLDGWWDEAYRADGGWAIASRGDDAADAAELYRLLEQEVVPDFYRRDRDGMPREWVARMRVSLAQLAPGFSSNRMLLEYLEHLYRPALRAFRRRCADGAAVAVELDAWERGLREEWRQLHFGPVAAERDGDDWLLSVPVYLGEIAPTAVRVELYADADDGHLAQQLPMQAGPAMPGALRGYVFHARVPALRPVTHYTPRVRAWHQHALLPAECPLLAWQR